MKLLNSILPSEIPEPFEKSLQYEKRGEEYLVNAEDFIIKRKFAKASEFLWGAVAEHIKAISVLYERPPASHRDIIEVGKRIATQLEDRDMFKLIDREAQALHANFYEEFLSEEAFADHHLAVLELVKKLRRILEKKRSELFLRKKVESK